MMQAARRQVILLGASNLSLGYQTISQLIARGFRDPLDLHAVIGHGRSYGNVTRLLFRTSPGIRNCELWETCGRSFGESSLPVNALITDIGNDLMYGTQPEVIASWVRRCAERLADWKADLVITRLPMARIVKLSAMRYHATRLTFFPFHSVIPWSEMLRRAAVLDLAVAEIGAELGATVVTPPLEWYGFDPIHIRLLKRRQAWRAILGNWTSFDLTRTQSGRRMIRNSASAVGGPAADENTITFY